MNFLLRTLAKTGFLKGDLDYHLIRVSMVVIYFFFGYQKWFDYEAQGLVPFFTHGPLIFWMYSVFGIKGSAYVLGVSEWLFGALLFAGFSNKKLGVLGSVRNYLYLYGHDHPLHARWLGRVSWRIPGDGWKCRVPDERRRSPIRISLPTETGCDENCVSCVDHRV